MTTRTDIHCLSCGEPAVDIVDMVATIDGRWVHSGACQQRVLLGNTGETSEARLWAAFTLWEMQCPPLVTVTPADGDDPVIGVIVEHAGNAFVLEDLVGAPHLFTAPVHRLEVVEDAWQA